MKKNEVISFLDTVAEQLEDAGDEGLAMELDEFASLMENDALSECGCGCKGCGCKGCKGCGCKNLGDLDFLSDAASAEIDQLMETMGWKTKDE